MVSINTNLSSLIVQNSLLKSTNALNQAIERTLFSLSLRRGQGEVLSRKGKEAIWYQ